jgi:hypothetical protein
MVSFAGAVLLEWQAMQLKRGLSQLHEHEELISEMEENESTKAELVIQAQDDIKIVKGYLEQVSICRIKHTYLLQASCMLWL